MFNKSIYYQNIQVQNQIKKLHIYIIHNHNNLTFSEIFLILQIFKIKFQINENKKLSFTSFWVIIFGL